MYGILTTGRTWQVYELAAGDEQYPNASEKLRVRLTGEFQLPVLLCAPDGDEDTPRNSGGGSVDDVDSAQVQVIMSMLIQSATGEDHFINIDGSNNSAN